MEVYVVRQFFEGSNDASYTGVYSDFFKAVLSAIADAKESDWLEPKYTFKIHPPHSFSGTELWCEIFHEGDPLGIYYTITKMELDK